MRKSKSGFTIVELLIVIVVIAILAAITIVAYSGIQQRAENSKTITAVNQTVKLLTMYKLINGDYPSQSGMVCIGTNYPNNVCAIAADGTTPVAINNSSFDAALKTVGTIPSPSTRPLTMSSGSVVFGASFEYASLMIRYQLSGASQPCTIGGATGPYNYGNVTQCRITLP